MAENAFTAVALAGGTLEQDFRAAGYGAVNKAYLPVAGEAMLTRVLRALRCAHNVGRIRCVTQRTALLALPGSAGLYDDALESRGDLVDSLLAGLEGMDAGERALIVATDLPLLTAASIDAFAQLAAQIPCDIGYGFVERSAQGQTDPQVRHTWVRLREGVFCGAGLSIMRVGAVTQLRTVLRRFTAARKSPLQLAALFSYRLLLKALLGRLSIKEVEQRACHISGLVCRGLLCNHAELAVNVDRLQDLRTVEQIIARR